MNLMNCHTLKLFNIEFNEKTIIFYLYLDKN